MSELRERINNDVKLAMKSGESEKVNALRLLTSAVKQVEVDTGKEPSDDEIVTLLRKELKKRQDSHKQFQDAGRTDLATKEEMEINIIQGYLPAQLSAEQVESKVQEILSAQNISEKKDFGKAMGMVMKELGSSADGNVVKEAVNKVLK